MRGHVVTEGELWQPMVDAIERADQPLLETAWDEERVVGTLRLAFKDFDLRQGVLHVLAGMSTEYTVALLDDLVGQALSIRDTLRVRNLLGRLPYKQAQELVPPAVWRLLRAEEENPDGPVYDAWMRMGELLEHLGLYDTLRELCDRARDSIDADVREVPDYFSDV